MKTTFKSLKAKKSEDVYVREAKLHNLKPKVDDRTGSMTGAPTMKQLKDMATSDNNKRMKQTVKVSKTNFSKQDTLVKNSTPMIKKKSAEQIYKGIDKGFNLIRRKKI